MIPVPIGYFSKQTMRRSTSPDLPPNVDELCNVACASPGPDGWIDLWLHNDMWLYDTELLAWAVATDIGNLRQLRERISARWDGVPGSFQKAMNQYIIRHTVLPEGNIPEQDACCGWDLYAYKAFSVRFESGREEPYSLSRLNVQPIPANYERLGYDPVSRENENTFSHSPLFCNGWWDRVSINRFCLLDDPSEAFRLARHFSDGKFISPGHYAGPAEPGPYFVLEVLRRKRPA